jgi:beta-phosphoglucomutase-like phosphatase (HAD superfamily)
MELVFDIQESITAFSNKLKNSLQVKAVFFDMDGVLFNSMPLHAKAWIRVFEEFGLTIPEFEPYLNEGSTAVYTAKKMFRTYRNLNISDEIADQIKVRKHEIMNSFPEPEIMNGMANFVKDISECGIDCWVVTGSAQGGLIDRIETEFPGSLFHYKMVTALDVKEGKPHPEPYLKAMGKSGYNPSEVIVIENAPMGVKSAKAAGLFTIAVNTGPINPGVLKKAGADLVFSGTLELINMWPSIYQAFQIKN